MNISKFKYFSNIKQEKHDKIINFFLKNKFGTNKPIMTYLSILYPIDRCIILEQLFNENELNSWDIRDKLLLAYIKIGRKDLAEKIIKHSILNGEDFFSTILLISKLDINASRINSTEYQLEAINTFKKKTKNDIEIQFLNLLLQFIYTK